MKIDNFDPIIIENLLKVSLVTGSSQQVTWNEGFEILVVRKGSIRLQVSFQKLTLTEGHCMVINDEETRSYYALDEDSEVLSLLISRDVYEKINNNFYEAIAIIDYMASFEAIKNHNQQVLTLVEQLLIDVLSYESVNIRTLSPEQVGTIEYNIKQLLDYLATIHTPDIAEKKLALIYRMITYIYSNFDAKPSLEEFSQLENYNFYHMSHLVSKVSGLSFRDWVNYVRVENSEKILLTSNSPITVIAEDVGFSNITYYNNCFKKWYGCLPSDYRRSFKPLLDITKSNPQSSSIDYSVQNYSSSNKEAAHSLLDNQAINTKNAIVIDCLNPEILEPQPFPQKSCYIKFSTIMDRHSWPDVDLLFSQLVFSNSKIIISSDDDLNYNNYLNIQTFSQFLEVLVSHRQHICIVADLTKNSVESVNYVFDFLLHICTYMGARFPEINLNMHGPFTSEFKDTLKKATADFSEKTMGKIETVFMPANKESLPDQKNSFVASARNVGENIINRTITTGEVNKDLLSKISSDIDVLDLVLPNGIKSSLFILQTLIQKMYNSMVTVKDWGLVSSKEKNHFILLSCNEFSRIVDSHIPQAFIIKNIDSTYKVTTYEFDLGSFNNKALANNLNLLNALTQDDIEELNQMNSPKVTFELVSVNSSYEKAIQFKPNTVQLIVLSLQSDPSQT